MSFKAKIDYCGLANGTSVLLKSHTEGASNSVATCANDEGDVIDATVYGHVIDPSNDYAIKSDLTDFDIVLGGVNTVQVGSANKYFMLKQVSINTSNSGEVTMSAQAEEVASATPSRTYTITLASLKQRNKAQILNSLFTLGGDNAHLQSANYTFSVDVNQTTVDGDRVTWDCYNGKVVATVTAKQAGSEAPTFTAGTNGGSVLILSKDNSETRPDSDYASVTAEITQYFTADEAASTSSNS